MLCFVLMFLWILVFHVVICVGRLIVQRDGFIRQLHFTTHTQYQVQSSFLLDVAVRLCPVIVHSICIPNSCVFHIAKTGLLRCCLYKSWHSGSRAPLSYRLTTCPGRRWFFDSLLARQRPKPPRRGSERTAGPCVLSFAPKPVHPKLTPSGGFLVLRAPWAERRRLSSLCTAPWLPPELSSLWTYEELSPFPLERTFAVLGSALF